MSYGADSRFNVLGSRFANLALLDGSTGTVAKSVADGMFFETTASTGSLAVTLDDATMASTAVAPSTVTVTATLDDATASATATARAAATLAVTLDDATMASTATLTVSGVVVGTLADATVSATVAVQVRATLSRVLRDATCTATAVARAGAAITATLDDATAASTALAYTLLAFEHYVGVIDPGPYRGDLAGPQYIGGVAATDYIGQLLEGGYRGVIDPEGDDMFAMVVGDRSPSFSATLKNAETGVAVDLTTATGVEAKFRINDGSDEGDITTAAAVVVTAASGTVRYDWADGDLDDDGTCQLRFVVTFPTGKKQTFPSDGSWYEFPVSE